MKIREKCYEGTLTNSPLRIKKGFNSQIVPSQNYLHHCELTSDKMSQIELMCQRYIEAFIGHSLFPLQHHQLSLQPLTSRRRKVARIRREPPEDESESYTCVC